MTFVETVTERTLTLQTRLCVGLDPRLQEYRDADHLRMHTLDVLEAAAPYAACVKPQLAFYEALGLPGMRILEDVCALSRTLGLPVLLDGKRGDIGSTAQAYAQGWLTGAHAGDALTVNPFLGFQTLRPFLDAAKANGGAIFVLVKTSNPDQADLQGGGISERVADWITRTNDETPAGRYGPVGAVVGATHPQELAAYRARLPRAMLLLPGLGAQGATPQDLRAAFYPDGTGALASASRAVQYAQGLKVQASIEAARDLRDGLNGAMD